MSEIKIVVPEGMRKAAFEAIREFEHFPHPDSTDSDICCGHAAVAVRAALTWLANNPIVPTHKQVEEISDTNVYYTNVVAEWITRWQRVMFLAPEPETPKEIEDLLLPDSDYSSLVNNGINERIAEAFQRGKKAGR